MAREQIVLLGSAEVIDPFSVLGIKCFELEEVDRARELLLEFSRDEEVGLILLAEKLAAGLLPEVEKIKRQTLPALFILPEYKTKTNLGLRRLENTLARAVGRSL